MTGRRDVVLVTAFEPFDGQAVNASQLAVDGLAARWEHDAHLVTAVLPVSFVRARRRLRELVAEHSPTIALGVGEAGGRAAVGLERVAVNVVDARIPDADGSAPVDLPVVAGAPAAFLATVPLKAMLVAARRTGVPMEVSGTAGTYVCNATFYALMHLADRVSGMRAGFVHVPRTPGQVDGDEPALATPAVVDALEAALVAALGTVPDLRVSAGTED